RVKGPVEYVVGAVRAGHHEYDESDPNYGPVPPNKLVKWANAMGQALFAPPNVKGWPGGRAWLNTSTVLERDNFAAALATGTLWTNPRYGPSYGAVPANAPEETVPARAFDPARLVQEEGANRPEEIVRVLL